MSVTTKDTVKRHRVRGAATYAGNCTHIVGEIKGPLTYGGFVVATCATYDEATDTTRVEFSHAVTGDLEHARADEHGILRTSLGTPG